MVSPYFSNEFGSLYLGKAEEVLPQLEINSVDVCVCSPPYWQARKYLADDELGQEPDYRDYISNLCNIFNEVKRVTKPTGSLFVNIGDKYYSRSVGTGGRNPKQNTNPNSFFSQPTRIPKLMPDGMLMNIPGRFADKMVDDCGWILKHHIIWHKPNAFTTSNKKKFTLDFETIWHFVLDLKNYYFKQQFEPLSESSIRDYERAIDKIESQGYARPADTVYHHDENRVTSMPTPNRIWNDKESLQRQIDRGRNKRSVWSINTNSRNSNHIAMYPEKLPEVPILACSPEKFGVVLDPFIGSGTTAVVAQKFNRRWVGIEPSEEYCKQAVERISKNER